MVNKTITSSVKLVYTFLDNILYIKTRESFIVFVYKTGYKQVFCLHEGLAGYWKVVQDRFVGVSCSAHYRRSGSLLPAS